MDPNVFHEVVCPLMQMDSACLICISTVKNGSDNFFSALINLKDENGAPVFYSVQIRLVCDLPQCAAAPEECIHCRAEIPDWQSVRKHKRVKLLMPPRLFRQETLGIMQEQYNPAHNHSHLNRMWTHKFCPSPLSISSNSRLPFIYTSLDPNRDGPSDMALTTLARVDGLVVVREITLYLLLLSLVPPLAPKRVPWSEIDRSR